MKQMLIRMPDDLHERLRARAAAEGRSATAFAVEAIDKQLSTVGASPRDRVRAALNRRRLLGGVDHAGSPDRELLRRDLRLIIGDLSDVIAEDRS